MPEQAHILFARIQQVPLLIQFGRDGLGHPAAPFI
jgi:hypothetical protein